MSKEMLINVSEGEECRIALLENGRVEELYMERTSATSHVGNIYKGRVTNVEASIQAAFVDFGLGRNGFLHISDLMPSYFGREGGDIQESVGRKLSRRDRPPIQRCLRRGDEIIVQIIKEGIGTKGPTLSTYISIPGRILVMMPGMGKFGVSRKIEDEDERRRLRQILDGLDPIDDVGFIIRTAGIGKTKSEIERDLDYLTRLWQNINRKLREPAPVQLYTEGDLVTRTVRDVYSNDLDRIVVDSREVGKRIQEFFKIAMPRTQTRIELYESPVPLFAQANIEREIELMYSRHVPLPSGGSLVIDSTEAIVAIDVNSGKFRDHNDAEMTAFKTDMEAADEIPRQLKLRDLGGVIICDFIDLRFERNRRELEERLHSNFKNDRAKTKVLRMSQFGIIELTRQRMRPSLKRSIYFDCPNCKGAGLVKTPESMSLDVMRRCAIAAYDARVSRVELTVCPDVGVYVLNKKRADLTALERDSGRRIIVKQDITLGLDEVKIKLFDGRDGNVFLEELGMDPNDIRDDVARSAQPPARNDRRSRGGGRPLPKSQQSTTPHHDDELDDLDQAEEAIEHRDHAGDLDELDRPAGIPIKQRAVSRAPLGKVIGTLLNDDIEAESERESSVIDVDEPHEPLGDGPQEFEEDQDRRYSRRDRPGRRPESRNDSRPPQRNDRRPDPARPPQRDEIRRDQPAGRDVVGRDMSGRAIAGRDMAGRDMARHDAAAHDAAGHDAAGHDAAGPRNDDESPVNGEGGPRRRRRRRGRRGRGTGQGANFDGPRQEAEPGDHEPEHEDAELTGHEHADAAFGTSLDQPESVGSAGEEIDGETIDAEFSSEESQSTTGPKDAGAIGDEGDRPRRRRRRGGRRHRRHRDDLPVDGAAASNGAAAEIDEEDADEFEDARAELSEAEDTGRPSSIHDQEVEAGITTEPAAATEPTAEVAAVETTEETPKRPRSRSRSSRATPQRDLETQETPTAKSEEIEDDAKPGRRRRGSKPTTGGRARATRKPPTVDSVPAAAVERTGSTDKHLVDDTPVDPEPPRRAASYDDLDAVPDDYDE